MRRMLYLVVAVLGLTLALAACSKTSATSVEKDMLAKVDKGDVAGALALVTDDASFAILGCPQQGCQGKAAIKTALDGVVAQHPKHTVTSSTDKDNIATSRVELVADLAKAAGAERMVISATVELKGDKVVRFQAQLDTSDPQTAKIAQFLSSQPAR